MVRDPFPREELPELHVVLDALEDPDCRRIIREVTDPMTASEIAEQCDIALSTTYRKLERLTEATLLEEITEIRSDGHHTSRYRLNFDEVVIAIEDDREFELAISRPARTADERLAQLWSEVRKEV